MSVSVAELTSFSIAWLDIPKTGSPVTWLMYELFLFGVEFELFYSVLFWYIYCVINKLYISLNYRLFLFPCVKFYNYRTCYNIQHTSF